MTNLHKINRSIFRYVEHELYSYHQTKKEIEDIRESIIEGTCKPESGSRTEGCTSDTTGSKVSRLLSSAALMRMERVINAIDVSLDRLGEQHRDLFRMKYQLRYPTEKICQEMPCSDRSFYRQRRELVEMVGSHLGFMAETWQD